MISVKIISKGTDTFWKQKVYSETIFVQNRDVIL